MWVASNLNGKDFNNTGHKLFFKGINSQFFPVDCNPDRLLNDLV